MPPTHPKTLNKLREIQRRDILLAAARVPNSDTLFVASSENKVYELDVSKTDSPAIEHANHGRYVTCVRLQGNTLISGGYDGRLIWWDREKRSAIRTVNAHSRWVRQIALTPDGTKAASVGDDMVCRIWNLATGEKLHELKGHREQTPTHFPSALYACVFSPNGQHLATGDRVGHVVIWDVATGRELAAVDAPTLYTWDGVQRIRSIGGVRGLAFSPDGQHLAVGGVGQIGNVDALQGPSRVEIFHWSKKEKIHEFTGAQGIINKLVYHPQGDFLACFGGGGNGIFILHDVAGKQSFHQAALPMHTHDALFNEDFTRFYAVGHQKIAVFELKA